MTPPARKPACVLLGKRGARDAAEQERGKPLARVRSKRLFRSTEVELPAGKGALRAVVASPDQFITELQGMIRRRLGQVVLECEVFPDALRHALRGHAIAACLRGV